MTDKKRWRLIIKDDLIHYKICAFWGWEKDETLNLKIYSTEERLYEVNNVQTEEILNPDGSSTMRQKIKYEDIKSTGFEVKKHTFHPSGYTHSTDRFGKRYKDGLKTIPFKKIETYQQLMVILPKNYKLSPIIDPIKLGQYDILIDPKTFNEAPFQIDVFIVHGKNNHPPMPTNMVSSVEIFCGDNEELLLFVRCLQTEPMLGTQYPPKTFIGTF